MIRKYKPVIAPLLASRQFNIIFASVPAVLILLEITDIFHWQCPFKYITRLDCPGCGLTRAVLIFLDGNICVSFRQHPFGILFVCVWILMAVLAVIGEDKRKSFTGKITGIEEKLPIIMVLFILFMLFGLVRVIFQIYD